MPASQANSSSIRTGNFPRLPRSIPKATATAIEIGWPAVRAGWQFGQATSDRGLRMMAVGRPYFIGFSRFIRLSWDPETEEESPAPPKACVQRTSAPKWRLSNAAHHRASRTRSIETCETHAPGASMTNVWWFPFVRTVSKAMMVSLSTFASIRPLTFCPETLPP